MKKNKVDEVIVRILGIIIYIGAWISIIALAWLWCGCPTKF